MLQVVVEDAISEALEADNLILQNMSTSKYVQVQSMLHIVNLNRRKENS